MLSTSFQKSEGSFYREYRLSPYQHAMLMHLLSEEKPKYTVIPDWENLFIITLLYAQMLSAKHKKAVVYSAWPLDQVEDVLRDVPDFYRLYKEVIRKSVALISAANPLDEKPGAQYSIGMGTQNKIQVGRGFYNEKNRYQIDRYALDFKLGLAREVDSFPYVHPTYVHEQVHPVWIITKPPSYDTKEEAFEVRKPLGRETLRRYKYFVSDFIVGGAYALYSSLARLGGGEKMLCNYSTFPNDYGPPGLRLGYYFLPYKFYLELPDWIQIKRYSFLFLDKGLTYLEFILLLFDAGLTYKDEARVRDYALETCGKFQLEALIPLTHHKDLIYSLPVSSKVNYWVFIDPSKTLCDTVEVSENLNRISPQEEERRRQLALAKKEEERLKEVQRRLERSLYEPKSKAGLTIPELRLLAAEHGVDLKGLKTKPDIARAILNRFRP